jgi:hypothetical protein
MTNQCMHKPVYLFALVISSIGVLHAQGGWIPVTTVRLKPEMIQDWRDTYKNRVIPGYRKAGVSAFAVWRKWPFGDAHELLLMSPIEKAQFDDEDPLQNALKAEERARTNPSWTDALPGSSVWRCCLWRIYPTERECCFAPQLIMVQTVSVAPKNASTYLGLLKDECKPLVEKSGVGIWLVYRHVFGSETSHITTIRSMKNYTELDGGPLVAQILGPQAASILAAKPTYWPSPAGSWLRSMTENSVTAEFSEERLLD